MFLTKAKRLFQLPLKTSMLNRSLSGQVIRTNQKPKYTHTHTHTHCLDGAKIFWAQYRIIKFPSYDIWTSRLGLYNIPTASLQRGKIPPTSHLI